MLVFGDAFACHFKATMFIILMAYYDTLRNWPFLCKHAYACLNVTCQHTQLFVSAINARFHILWIFSTEFDARFMLSFNANSIVKYAQNKGIVLVDCKRSYSSVLVSDLICFILLFGVEMGISGYTRSKCDSLQTIWPMHYGEQTTSDACFDWLFRLLYKTNHMIVFGAPIWVWYPVCKLPHSRFIVISLSPWGYYRNSSQLTLPNQSPTN